MRIGVLRGRENSFPDAFIARVNSMGRGVSAEFVQLGGTKLNEPVPYRVLLDRISHDVPYYSVYLKMAALQGAYCINNIFWRTADDKFFGYAAAEKLGIKEPRTVVLPNRENIADVTADWAVVAQLRGGADLAALTGLIAQYSSFATALVVVGVVLVAAFVIERREAARAVQPVTIALPDYALAASLLAASLLLSVRMSARELVAVWGNNDHGRFHERLPEVARVEIEGVRLGVIHETGDKKGREKRCSEQFPDLDVLVFGHSHIPWDTTTATGLRLKHDHRHEDGHPDKVTLYGGDTADAGPR